MDQVQQKFSDLSRKLINRVAKTDIFSVFDFLELENLKSISPNNKNNITIINFSGKRVKLIWIDYKGKKQEDHARLLKENFGFYEKIGTYSNHLYRIQFDADDSSSESIHFRIPEDKSLFYFGNENGLEENYLKLVYDSCWITNPSIKSEHLDLLEKFFDHKPDQLTKTETLLIQSYSYDDSSETSDLINSFYGSFSVENKFTDPFFNPLNRLEPKFTVKRISEHEVSIEKKVFPSVYLGEEFCFTIKNDTDADIVLYWISYNGVAESKFFVF